jgi:hypothetical protein
MKTKNRVFQTKTDVNFLAYVKSDGNKFVLFYDDEQEAEALRMIGRWACNPDLSFTWTDAAALSQRIRERRDGAETH